MRTEICFCHGRKPDTAIQYSVSICLMFLWMLLVSLTFRKLFWNFFRQLQLQWILNICPMQDICYLFWQPSVSSIQRKKKKLPSVLQFFALPSSNKLILWCSSICSSFLSLQSRLEGSLADLVFGDLEGKGLGVGSSVISFLGYFFISSINLCLYYKTT